MTTTEALALIMSIAKAAQAHRSSVERRLLGLPVRGNHLQARIDTELARRGITPGAVLYPASAPPPSRRSARL